MAVTSVLVPLLSLHLAAALTSIRSPLLAQGWKEGRDADTSETTQSYMSETKWVPHNPFKDLPHNPFKDLANAFNVTRTDSKQRETKNNAFNGMTTHRWLEKEVNLFEADMNNLGLGGLMTRVLSVVDPDQEESREGLQLHKTLSQRLKSAEKFFERELKDVGAGDWKDRFYAAMFPFPAQVKFAGLGMWKGKGMWNRLDSEAKSYEAAVKERSSKDWKTRITEELAASEKEDKRSSARHHQKRLLFGQKSSVRSSARNQQDRTAVDSSEEAEAEVSEEARAFAADISQQLAGALQEALKNGHVTDDSERMRAEEFPELPTHTTYKGQPVHSIFGAALAPVLDKLERSQKEGEEDVRQENAIAKTEA